MKTFVAALSMYRIRDGRRGPVMEYQTRIVLVRDAEDQQEAEERVLDDAHEERVCDTLGNGWRLLDWEIEEIVPGVSRENA
jgi:hypothetical protein